LLFGLAILSFFPYFVSQVNVLINNVNVIVMSKVSSKARYEAFSEWFKWAQTKYPSMKRKKKVRPDHLPHAEGEY
jgi:hypothetical protein